MTSGMPPTIALLGDVMLGRSVARELQSTDPADLWSPEVRELVRSCDAVVCNLECCVSERGTHTERVRGKPFFFRAPPAAIDSLASIGVRVAGLANNHALDFEEEALGDTLSYLQEAGIEVRAGSAKGLIEEAPEAYKDVEQVVDVVAETGIGAKVARLRPIAIIKG